MDDGGRAGAGFKGQAPGDCVVRSIAITTGLEYRRVYDEINALAGKPVARTGVPRPIIRKYLDQRGAVWTPKMEIGTGCTVHVAEGEVPATGRFILSLSKHLTALVDGVIHDTFDPGRDGTRCVYGWWELP